MLSKTGFTDNLTNTRSFLAQICIRTLTVAVEAPVLQVIETFKLPNMKTAILVAILLSVVSVNAIERLLVSLAGNTRTSTFMKIETTVLPLTVPVTCAVHVGVAGNCRRRRGIEERPIIVEADEGVDISKVISPNQPFKVETTAVPEFEPVAPDTPQEEINSVLDASFDTEAGQRNGKLFGVSVVYKTTSTFKATSYTTVHSGLKSFVVSVCTPEGFPYPKC